ncbi:MAG: hypothetical protein WAZ77_02895 [Candidatus Nitrosopolaris sp.]
MLEALKKLEKLKRIEWVDDSRVILSENLAKISGSTYDVYVEKIIHGRALVIVNGKWHLTTIMKAPENYLERGLNSGP